jgi:Uroporphyrinogen-III decarboxylase
MNQKENLLSAVRCKGSEYTPVFLRDLTLGLDASGMRTTDVFSRQYDPKASAESVLALQRMIGHDAVVGCIHTYSLEAFGGITKYPEFGIPYLSVPPFADISRMDNYVPADIDDALLEGMYRSYRIIKERAPELAVVMNVGGPVNTAGNLRGIEQFLMDTYTERELADEIMKFSYGVMETIIDKLHEGSDAVFLASASDNPDMFGPEGFERFSLPCIRKNVKHSHSLGLPVIFHPHGVFSTEDRKDVLKMSVDTGIDGFQFAEGNEPEGILEGTKGRCSIMGGVDAFTTLLLGPEKRIVRDTHRFMDVLSHEDYVFMCSCSLNRGLSIENVRTMVNAVRTYSRE